MSEEDGIINIALDTLGCKLNQAETELLADRLVEVGLRRVSSVAEADIYIVNTCTVTHIADRKSRHLLRLTHRRNPDAVIVAIGCYTQRAANELAAIEGVRLVLGNDAKMRLPELLAEYGYLKGKDENRDGFRNRTFIRVQDGCNRFCSYCIVPLVWGRERSFLAESIISEIGVRISAGYKEAVLTGTEIGAYRCDGLNLAGLIGRILSETCIQRLRLSSLQPNEINRELITLWKDKRLCPHFHLSLQSGSDDVLQRMKRHYTTADYLKAVSLIRSMVPNAAITTDVIVGFPSETDEEFDESYGFCRNTGFARIHVFPYSPRPGTEAAGMSGQVRAVVKRERLQK
ncbi:MAG TPA: tRNA (N(6)-L-threonylcarbamoyladenosine(37)-C(2))-methylthiotransferase MtaB, partial [Dehalococcoidia bacterium]|nr:tRNA (N(6)-L-threonylcarbamoyladenosine(37)-C(2))-methylthiotransferase MtaB [Dehalococcoidia bacterium]